MLPHCTFHGIFILKFDNASKTLVRKNFYQYCRVTSCHPASLLISRALWKGCGIRPCHRRGALCLLGLRADVPRTVLMKKIGSAILLCSTLWSAGALAQVEPQAAESLSPVAALATPSAALPTALAATDSLTTWAALSSGKAAEANSLINTSPAGLLGLFALKAGLVHFVNQRPAHERDPALKGLAGMWGGVSVNNLALLLGTTGPVAIAAGIMGAVGFYQWEAHRLAEEAALPALAPAPELVPPGTAIVASPNLEKTTQ